MLIQVKKSIENYLLEILKLFFLKLMTSDKSEQKIIGKSYHTTIITQSFILLKIFYLI